ncbi:ATPase family AAA domain-containing protein 3B [Madurella mycetomatis]|uniref:ATPase family AAA domain-containing protein 3B n=1 Tax=Madurella mycetomatis TaxID=100816 RepID=A0A175VQC7_9PEZI|nr:ATPase family AAA domain-containing protein 3B [Madurella mycetomatis]
MAPGGDNSDSGNEGGQKSEALSSDAVHKLVEYLKGLEARILQLESGNRPSPKAERDENEGKDKDKEKSTDGKEEQETAKEDGKEEQKEKEGKEEGSSPTDPYHAMQFAPKFHDVARKGPDLANWRSTSTNIKDPKDPRFINAFCIRTKKDANFDDNLPKAEDVDLIAFAVWSEPIVDFVVKELGAQVDTDYKVVYFEKPFKTVIRSIEPLKKHLEGLKRRYGRVEATAVNGTSSPGASPPDSTSDAAENREMSGNLPFVETEDDTVATFNRPVAIPHFQGLVDFVDNYLAPQIALLKRLREGTERAVAFENLWMLFDAHDIIYCPIREAGQISIGTERHKAISRHTPQAYRVLATTGGTPLTSTMVPHPQSKPYESFFQQYLPRTTQNSAAAAVGATGSSADYPGPQPAFQATKAKNSYTPFYIFCFYIDFNGLEFGTVCDTFEFKPYEQEMSIRDLQVFPLRYASPNVMVDRGKKFMDATKVSHMQYSGMTVGQSREEISSSVVVDMKLAYESDPSTRYESITPPSFISFSNNWFELEADCAKDEKAAEKAESDVKTLFEEYEDWKKSQGKMFEKFKEAMEHKELITLLPGAVPGFSLRNRRWVLLDITQLTPVKQSDEWKNLVLPKGHRQMVQAMVETHTKQLSLVGKEGSEKIGMDLVRGKAKGCIILLHGVPGVGKTSTAECVAAHTKKPLYPITCGDIGYEPTDVEKNMEQHFKLAHKWGCVLLLDEADVFLAKRDEWAVFLRILEYYNGILFLTTNRVGAIDDAFRSRLHLTLYYPKLTEKQTLKIFKRNFERIGEINEGRRKNNLPEFRYEKSQKKVMAWAKKKWETLRWNGRQIRNTFQTAMALAEFHAKDADGKSKAPVLSKKYFNVVATASDQFNKYLVAVHGMDEERVAKRDLIRAEDHSYKPPTTAPNLDFEGSISDSSDSSSEEGGDGSDTGASSDSDSDTSDTSEDEKSKKKGKSKGKTGKTSSGGNAKTDRKTSSKKDKKGKLGKDGKKDRKSRGESDDSEEED